jgi:DNA-binding NarL/FixJ family response regulator
MVTIGIQMPVMNGLETIPILKTKYPALKIIVISMVNDSSMICRVMQLGANAYLTKSASSAEIYEAILACRNSWLFINNTLRGALLETAPENIIKGGFNERELHIMRLLQQGKTIPELSAALNLGERTINAIIDRLFTKTNSNTIAGVLQYAMEKGNNLSQTD